MQMDIQMSHELKQMMTLGAIFHLEMLQLTNEEVASLIAEKALENPLLEVSGPVFDYTEKLLPRSSSDSHREFLMQQESIKQHLWELIPLKMELSPLKKTVLNVLMDYLDEHLFLRIEAQEVCERMSIPIEVVNECIELLQSLEPFGVASKSSQHFLERQILLDPYAPPFATVFIQQELNTIAQLNVPYLMKKYKLSKQQVLATIQYIKKLEPFPSMPTLQERTLYITPDVEITNIYGNWHVQLDATLIPKVTVNEGYVELLKEQSHLQDYLQQSLKEAKLLVEGLEERTKTLHRIMYWIIGKQHLFLETGQAGMIPLRLIDAANELDLHESTISRAIRNKYVKTPYGIFSFKHFFPKGIAYNDNPNSTSDWIKERIQQLIASESATNPLSDQQLANMLKKEHIHLSRRTVAKYRESLLIPNSNKRTYI